MKTLRACAQAFSAGDQTPPCAVLWPDPDRFWEGLVPRLRQHLPELFVLGTYDPKQGTGPALWLRCVEAGLVEGALPAGTMPVFYLPGVSREQLRGVEDCPARLAALVELQFRGMVWLHINGKEWTPCAMLVSKHGGLGLDLPRDQATQDALAGALPRLLDEPVEHLRGRLLDAEFFNQLVAPDAASLLLHWLANPEAFRKQRSEPELRAFSQQCKADFRFDPEKDGPLRAATLLTERANPWGKVWKRFTEAPDYYPGIVDWLKRAAPKEPSVFDTPEVWPHLNERDERHLREALETLANRPPDEIASRIADLEKQHGARRKHVWARLGLSPLAETLEPLAALAAFCNTSPGAPTAGEFAGYYAGEGWRVDAAALAVMAACGTLETHAAVLNVLRALYLPWLERTARHLQGLIQVAGGFPESRGGQLDPTPGRLLLFADGLRLDVARQLAARLAGSGLETTFEWDWSTVPSVTASAKPAVSPLAREVAGDDAGAEFNTRLIATGQPLNQERFVGALRDRGWQVLNREETGDASGFAWTECGTLDKHGHAEGWKMARVIETEVRDLASRIGALLDAGWKEVIVLTDHGWVLVPGGLPKVELKSFLTAGQWGRCAAMKPGVGAHEPVLNWHWNREVAIASPPGVGCFRASVEYSHGGISLQEMVIPRLRITRTGGNKGMARLAEAKWTGARCRIGTSGGTPGLRVDVRTRLSDPATSILADRQARETGAEGKVSVFVENDSDIGKTALIVLLDPAGQVIDSLETVIGDANK